MYPSFRHVPATYQLRLDRRRKELWGCLKNNTNSAATNNRKGSDYCGTRLGAHEWRTSHLISLSLANMLRPMDRGIL